MLLILVIIIFIIGLYYYINKNNNINNINNINNNYKIKNSNIIFEKDGKIYLFSDTISLDKNPIIFNNLEDYIEFNEMEKSKNINYPTIYLQYGKDTQNNDILMVKPSIIEINGGLMPSKLISNNLIKKENNNYEIGLTYYQEQQEQEQNDINSLDKIYIENTY